MRIVAIIPARYASSRFPAKLLATIQGKSVLHRTWQQAKSSALVDHVLIACDDERIFEHAKEFGADVLMTCQSCLTGSDRLIEALQKYPDKTSGDIIVNIQGDEPCIPKQTIDATIQAIIDHPDVVMASASCPLANFDEILHPSVVKVVCDIHGNALYFSRSPIPGMHPKATKIPSYAKHLGIYAYRRDFLLHYGTLPSTPLQQIEELEQLKVLEAGYKIRIVQVASSSPHVDIPEDIQQVEKWLCNQNTSS